MGSLSNVTGFKHGTFHDDGIVQSLTGYCIAVLAENYRMQEVGN
ncbi:MAG: hypothetical protein ACRYF4_07770 [Janthinobacterium lividum]